MRIGLIAVDGHGGLPNLVKTGPHFFILMEGNMK